MEGSFFENELLIAILIGIMIMLLFAFTFIVFFYFSQKKFQTEQIKTQHRELEYQAQLLFSTIETQEKERARIARELHDEIGSKLNVINLNLHRARKNADLGIVSDVLGILEHTIDNTRQIAHQLLPPILTSFGLVAALQEICDNYDNAKETVSVSFELTAEKDPIEDANVSLAFFRITQELLSNSFKYSEASEIKVSLSIEKTMMKLTYSDNGKGFDPGNQAHHTGLGMQNIESRARMIDAQQQLLSSPGKGIFFELVKHQ